ncbi:Arv1-like family domain containing protein [Tylopilus felleus]
MAICITCAQPISHLYNNASPSQSQCLAFADSYAEHDTLTLLLDLILLKRGVYRHLLYNRGTEPRKAYKKTNARSREKVTFFAYLSTISYVVARQARWLHILRLGSGLVLVDACQRSRETSDHGLSDPRSPQISQWSTDMNVVFSFVAKILLSPSIHHVSAETLAFRVGVVSLHTSCLNLDSDWIGSWKALRSNSVGRTKNTTHGTESSDTLV